ncbi:MAG: hypothetical protein V7717_08305 [Porticoccaceae bacterium]
MRKFRIVQTEGKRQVERELDHYSLDAIISIGHESILKQAPSSA